MTGTARIWNGDDWVLIGGPGTVEVYSQEEEPDTDQLGALWITREPVPRAPEPQAVAKIERPVAMSIANSAWTQVVYTAGAVHSEYLTADHRGLTAERAGLYVFIGRVGFDGNATGGRYSGLTVDEVLLNDTVGGPNTAPYGMWHQALGLLSLSPGQLVGQQVAQFSGAGQNIGSAILTGARISE